MLRLTLKAKEETTGSSQIIRNGFTMSFFCFVVAVVVFVLTLPPRPPLANVLHRSCFSSAGMMLSCLPHLQDAHGKVRLCTEAGERLEFSGPVRSATLAPRTA